MTTRAITRASNWLSCVATLLVVVCVAPATPAGAANLPAGFTEALVTGGLSSPTAMQFAPDGRLFVCEQGGSLRVIKNGALLATPFVSLTVSSAGERGLLGVAFDPNFSVNQFVYVYYTATTPTVHNRISRFTANGDVAASGSELVLLDLESLGATNHNGGALNFGPDGKLYAAVGENAVASNAQTLTNLLGKVLRINADGSIPTDNPFYNTAGVTGNNRAIWALGLRNPFTFAFNRAGTRMLINDVGQGTWEEIDDGSPGANYGWPVVEGPNPPNQPYTYPRHAYDHASTGGCAITGGAFYDPAVVQFPSYLNHYFFADLCGGWIRRLDVSTNAVTPFATGISQPVDLKVGADGALYYLARGIGSVYRIRSTTTADSVTPSSGSGASQTFALQYSSTAGVNDLATLWVWFNGTFAATAANSCLVYYERSSNRVFLINDAGTAWLSSPMTPGASNIENSRCVIQTGASVLSGSGNSLTLNLAVIFKPPSSGAKTIFMYAAGSNGTASGWQTRGTWTVSGAISVTADSVTPSSGSGASQTFALQYSSTAGFNDLATLWVWFNDAFAATAANSCLAYYERSTNRVFLINDAGTAWSSSAMTPGAGNLENSRCAIQTGASVLSGSGNSLTLNLAVIFKAPFSGAKTIFMYAAGNNGAASGWQNRGTWTVSGSITVTADSASPNSGSGANQAFSFTYSDSAGYADLATAWVWFSASFASTAANSCLIYYDRPSLTLFLLDDTGTTWMGATVPNVGVLENSQCRIQLQASTVQGPPTGVILNLSLSFKQAFTGAKTIFMYAAGSTTNSGWQTRGSWIVP